MNELLQSPLDFTLPQETDPIEEAKKYRDTKWFQQKVVFTTACYHCGKESPLMAVTCDSNKRYTFAFGDPFQLRRGTTRYADLTKEVQLACAKEGWKFQKYRSFCPTCKGLGSV